MALKTMNYLVRHQLKTDCGRGQFPDPTVLYLAAFNERTAAEEYTAALHRSTFLDLDPERHPELAAISFLDGLTGVTALPEYALRDFLLDGGIQPPALVEPTNPEPCRFPETSEHQWALEQRRWASWWNGLSRARQEEERQNWAKRQNLLAWDRWWRDVVAGGRLTPDQRLRICEAFNTVSFFEVVESSRLTHPPVRSQVYAIVQTSWVYYDYWDFDSHDVLGLFSTRKAAEVELARQRSKYQDDQNPEVPRADDLTVVELPLDPEAGR